MQSSFLWFYNGGLLIQLVEWILSSACLIGKWKFLGGQMCKEIQITDILNPMRDNYWSKFIQSIQLSIDLKIMLVRKFLGTRTSLILIGLERQASKLVLALCTLLAVRIVKWLQVVNVLLYFFQLVCASVMIFACQTKVRLCASQFMLILFLVFTMKSLDETKNSLRQFTWKLFCNTFNVVLSMDLSI